MNLHPNIQSALILALALIATTLVSNNSNAQTATGTHYIATVERVLDGDTIDVRLTVWPQIHVTTRVRIHGIDTPEKRTRKACEKELGRAATAWAQAWFAQNPQVQIGHVQHGKYAGRLLASVTDLQGNDYAEQIIAAGHAVAYYGDTKQVWCDG